MKTRKPAEGQKLTLTNSGDLSLFFLGTGGAFSKVLDQTNLLIVKGEDHLLVDCGTKASQALFNLGCPITEIRNFFITHTHSDHIGGLEEVVLLGRYAVKRRPRVIVPEYFEHVLWDSALRGGCAFNERHDGSILSFGDLCEPIRPRWIPDEPRECWEADIGSIHIKFFRTKHIPDSAPAWETSFPSFGMLIDGRVFFSSDTRFDPELIRDYAAPPSVETVFHDCQLFPGGVHASLDELSTLPEKIRRKTYLTHYQDTWEKAVEKAEAAGFAGFARQKTWYDFSAAESCKKKKDLRKAGAAS